MWAKLIVWSGLGLYALLSVVDWMLTFALLRINNLAVESNPLAAAWLDRYGWRGLALFKAVGVGVFAVTVLLLLRRRPAVAAGVVTLGCAVLLMVTTYSHRLICESHREAEQARETTWPRKKPTPPPENEFGIPERCWFATGKPRNPATATTDTRSPQTTLTVASTRLIP